MRVITITIQVPDGVEVRVNGAQPSNTTSAGGGGTFTPQPDPPYPPASCEVCGGDWRLIKGGFSKTKKNADGTPKRFNAFYVCATDGCEGKPNYDLPVSSIQDLPF